MLVAGAAKPLEHVMFTLVMALQEDCLGTLAYAAP